MSEEYVELEDLPRKEREAKVKQYLAEKKESFSRFKAKVASKYQAAQQRYQEMKAKAQPTVRKARKVMVKVQKAARKFEKRRASQSGGGDLFGDLGFVSQVGGGGSSRGGDELGMGAIFGAGGRSKGSTSLTGGMGFGGGGGDGFGFDSMWGGGSSPRHKPRKKAKPKQHRKKSKGVR